MGLGNNLFNEKFRNLIMENAEQYGHTIKSIPNGAGHDVKYINELGPIVMIL